MAPDPVAQGWDGAEEVAVLSRAGPAVGAARPLRRAHLLQAQVAPPGARGCTLAGGGICVVALVLLLRTAAEAAAAHHGADCAGDEHEHPDKGVVPEVLLGHFNTFSALRGAHQRVILVYQKKVRPMP